MYQKDPALLPFNHPVRLALATCHSIACVKGELIGHPNDIKQFEAVKFFFSETTLNPAMKPYPAELAVLKPKAVLASGLLRHTGGDDVFCGDPEDFEVAILLIYPFSPHLRVNRYPMFSKVDRLSKF